jgi:type IV pilus assembly protein PilM
VCALPIIVTENYFWRVGANVSELTDKLQEIIGGFSNGPTVGVDLGSHSIKVCEISGGKGKLKLERFAAINLGEAVIIEDEFQKPDEIIGALKNALRVAGSKSRNVSVGLYGQNTMTKRLSVPDGTQEEIQDSIIWESEQYIPFGADESEVSFSIIGDTVGGGKDVLLVAARTEVVEHFQDLLKEAKLIPKIVDLNVVAASNLFEMTAVALDPSLNEGAILIDWGAQSVKIIIYRNGGPIFTKELAVGGSLVTEEIQRQMALSYEEAEDLKISQDAQGNLPEEILGIAQGLLEGHIAEVKKNLNFYISAGSTEQITKCFVFGGGARSPLLIPMLTELLGIEVQVFNPFEFGLSAVGKLKDMQDQIASTGVTAMGLALRK